MNHTHNRETRIVRAYPADFLRGGRCASAWRRPALARPMGGGLCDFGAESPWISGLFRAAPGYSGQMCWRRNVRNTGRKIAETAGFFLCVAGGFRAASDCAASPFLRRLLPDFRDIPALSAAKARGGERANKAPDGRGQRRAAVKTFVPI